MKIIRDGLTDRATTSAISEIISDRDKEPGTYDTQTIVCKRRKMMNKRIFLKSLLGLSGLSATQKIFGKISPRQIDSEHDLATKAESLLIQKSPLAGFQYYHAEEIWRKMYVGDVLELIHDKHNRYDR